MSRELLCDYYVRRYGLDGRGVRYPRGNISETLPGIGTTDYAAEMFYAALRGERYTCLVRADTVFPVICMPDCIKAAPEFLDADGATREHRNGFNLAAMSFSAAALADEIAAHVSGFDCTFEPDERQAISESWPRSLDDAGARREWGWHPEFDLAAMTTGMLQRLRARGVGAPDEAVAR